MPTGNAYDVSCYDDGPTNKGHDTSCNYAGPINYPYDPGYCSPVPTSEIQETACYSGRSANYVHE